MPVCQDDAAARLVSEVNANFHPRYDALTRKYAYEIFCQPQRDPLRQRYAWRVWPAPSFEMMQAAAQQLVGTHDFAAFGRPPIEHGTTLRQVSLAYWDQQEDRLRFVVEANAFLYHMVRRMVNLLVEIGRDRAEPNIINEKLGDPAEMIQGLAPAHGLFLKEVTYADESNH